MSKRPAATTVSKLLHYNPRTGALTWREHKGNRKKGDPAGCIFNQNGVPRFVVCIDGKMIPSPLLVWLLKTGEYPKTPIYFKNRNPLDMRWTNMCVLTVEQKPWKPFFMGAADDFRRNRHGAV